MNTHNEHSEHIEHNDRDLTWEALTKIVDMFPMEARREFYDALRVVVESLDSAMTNHEATRTVKGFNAMHNLMIAFAVLTRMDTFLMPFPDKRSAELIKNRPLFLDQAHRLLTSRLGMNIVVNPQKERYESADAEAQAAAPISKILGDIRDRLKKLP